ncbi:helix-turn-helix domain-containing protein [Corynebacterium striatum]|uniref:helix-turn-helix domain-containing protein n=1 Tax=Corynebacterium striatum TaxID=43770 RepID=UPI000C443318|nr:helix-turn-helix transcriptional regulator [Corynebacterium striatum]MDC7105327.1 helix-turn-helix transcriptional regulator [Corynebacterium striatum]MDK7884121.1 helix-turn-helix transcriptional regulator [Corynebacterium striatum]MDK8833672.1 helix-turn-helix transcriptional regulator [Corynebacterium striatum]MDK8843219.1 helix-turn-helix transcriptional regulator [Corynebacterium striatum]PIS59685.1 DNA-binding protein [Corynebacterium striatum]
MSISFGGWSALGHDFASRLREARERRGMSQKALAEISGVSRSQISNLERTDKALNLRADPQLSTLFKLAYALEVPPSLLLPGGVGDEVVAALDDVAAFSASYIDRRRFAAADMVLD